MKRVMLVEDEEFILQGILCINDWKGMDMEVVHMAHNGREALEKFRQEPVDIVVTDVEMPLMNGLELIREIRAISRRVRCLILSGYDEFEYARTALKLDVDEYILKPINEEQLSRALREAAERLDEIDRKNAVNMEDKIGWLQFLENSDRLGSDGRQEFFKALPGLAGQKIFSAIMKIDVATLGEGDGINRIMIERQKYPQMKSIYLKPDVLLLLYYCGQEGKLAEAENVLQEFQDQLESEAGIMSFIAVAEAVSSYAELPEAYARANRLLRYRILTGYGRCISEEDIRNRGTRDVILDEAFLRKKILEKDQDRALQYIEELFMNRLEAEADVDMLYRIALKIIMLLQDIAREYKIQKAGKLENFSDLFEKIYQAEDLCCLKTILMLEVRNAIGVLNTEVYQYTPVVREILHYMQENYKEDMNLKVLSYKYHMNASYLGQIFQKEVGCSFSQYLSNIKNEKAKDLILNTNMKIADVAKEVGYPDISYFYKKFKQCYGVSPASLRNMKKY